jgi:hypothetical protein
MKRLYMVVKRRKPDGIVDAHLWDCLNIPALAFATSYWNGEQMPGVERKTQALPLDRFRTEFMGHNIGVPADLLYYKLGDYNACTALALLHDVPVRSEKETELEILSSIWRVREAFGCGEAEFIGYWGAGRLVETAPEGCYASLWRHAESGVLAAVSNLTLEPAEVRLTFDVEKLGLPASVTAVDARTEKPLPLEGNRLRLSLQPQDWSLVWLRGSKSGR